MPRLELLRADHEAAVLVFELANRAFFARAVGDRGDAYFAEFDERYRALLEEQRLGTVRMHVLVDDGGSTEVLGRFNLVDLADGEAELGYRVTEHATGRGLATAYVRETCALAASTYGLTTIRADVTDDNPASRAVLLRCGFAPVEPVVVGGRAGTRFRLALDASEPRTR